MTLWYLGYPDQALQRSHEALTLARELAHPFSLAIALFFAAWLHQFRREWPPDPRAGRGSHRPRDRAGVCALGSGGDVLRGWALAERSAAPGAGQGQGEEGMAQMHQGLAAWRATGAEVLRPYCLALLAEAYAQVGQREEGLTLLAEALAVTNDTGERRWEAELYRLKGEFLLAQRCGRMHAEAEACFRRPSTLPAASRRNPGSCGPP